MDRSPIKSKWADFLFRFHEGVFIRRKVLHKLYDKRLEKTVLFPMAKHYVSCLLSSLFAFFVLRKEKGSVKFVAVSGTLSICFIYVQLWYEEKIFYFKGLEDTPAGEIIRESFIELMPNSWISQDFQSKQKKILEKRVKYHYRDSPMEKFRAYTHEASFKPI